MHRREAGLRPEADQHQRKRHPHERRVQGARTGAQLVPCERGRRLSKGVTRRVVREENAEEREAEPDGADHEVLPCRLERVTTPEERHEERRRERRRLDGDPHQPEVVQERDGEHRGDRELEPDVEPAHLIGTNVSRVHGVAHVSDGAECRDRGDEGDDEDDESRQCIDIDESADQPFRRTREGVGGERDGDGERYHRGTRTHRGGTPRAQRRDERGGERQSDKERREAQPRSIRSSSVFIVSKCSLIRSVSTAVTPTATRRSKKTPISTNSGIPSVAMSPARKMPFSIVMRPMSCETALRRVVIRSRPMKMSARDTGSASRAGKASERLSRPAAKNATSVSATARMSALRVDRSGRVSRRRATARRTRSSTMGTAMARTARVRNAAAHMCASPDQSAIVAATTVSNVACAPRSQTPATSPRIATLKSATTSSAIAMASTRAPATAVIRLQPRLRGRGSRAPMRRREARGP